MGASFAVVDVVRHRRPTAAGAPRGARNPSMTASSSPRTRACFPSARSSSLLLSQPCLHFGRQPQHSSYELVPADVIRYKNLIQRCSWAYHSRPFSRLTRKPPTRKSNLRMGLLMRKPNLNRIIKGYPPHGYPFSFCSACRRTLYAVEFRVEVCRLVVRIERQYCSVAFNLPRSRAKKKCDFFTYFFCQKCDFLVYLHSKNVISHNGTT